MAYDRLKPVSYPGRHEDHGSQSAARNWLPMLPPVAAVLLAVAGCSSSKISDKQSLNGRPPDGTVDMNQVQAAFIGSGGGGSGTLNY
jgi:hypothetical protein